MTSEALRSTTAIRRRQSARSRRGWLVLKPCATRSSRACSARSARSASMTAPPRRVAGASPAACCARAGHEYDEVRRNHRGGLSLDQCLIEDEPLMLHADLHRLFPLVVISIASLSQQCGLACARCTTQSRLCRLRRTIANGVGGVRPRMTALGSQRTTGVFPFDQLSQQLAALRFLVTRIRRAAAAIGQSDNLSKPISTLGPVTSAFNLGTQIGNLCRTSTRRRCSGRSSTRANLRPSGFSPPLRRMN